MASVSVGGQGVVQIWETRPKPNLSRPELYSLAAKADADLRVVTSEIDRWRAGIEPSGRVRERIRREAMVLGLVVSVQVGAGA